MRAFGDFLSLKRKEAKKLSEKAWGSRFINPNRLYGIEISRLSWGKIGRQKGSKETFKKGLG